MFLFEDKVLPKQKVIVQLLADLLRVAEGQWL